VGLLDDAIREHLELKRRHGAAEEEVAALEKEALKSAPQPAARDEAPAPEPPAAAEPEPQPELPAEPAVEIPAPAPAPAPRVEPEPWMDEPDEVPFEEALDHRRPQPTTEFSAEDVAEAHGEPVTEYVAPDEEPGDDLLEETPDFLQETPEHDRLWFEQKPPRDFDFGS
jgi:hypothetical protein